MRSMFPVSLRLNRMLLCWCLSRYIPYRFTDVKLAGDRLAILVSLVLIMHCRCLFMMRLSQAILVIRSCLITFDWQCRQIFRTG